MGKIGWGSNELVEGASFENGIYTFSDCKFVRTDFDGQIDDVITVFEAVLTDDDGNSRSQSWSVGGKDLLRPTQDEEDEAEEGPYLMTLDESKVRGVHESSNFGMLVASLGICGFPEDKFDGSAPCLDGLKADMVEEEIEMKGRNLKPMKNKKQGDGPQKRYVPVVKEILGMPGEEEKGGKAKAANKTKPASSAKSAKSTPSTKAADSDSDDLTDEAVGIVMEILADKGGKISKGALTGAAFKATNGMDNRQALVKLIGNKDFLADDERPWDMDGNNLVMPE